MEQYQPKTGAACHCRPGVHRDNCPDCEGTGQRIDFAAIRARSNRLEYFDGKVSHADYYAQFVTPALTAYVVRCIGADAIQASTDPHMNDIPLARWDRLEGVKDLIDVKTFKACNNVSYAPESRDKFLWSLSDQVCCAKQAARMWKAAREAAERAS